MLLTVLITQFFVACMNINLPKDNWILLPPDDIHLRFYKSPTERHISWRVQNANTDRAIHLLREASFVEITTEQAQALIGFSPPFRDDDGIYLLRGVALDDEGNFNVTRYLDSVLVLFVKVSGERLNARKAAVVVQLPREPSAVYVAIASHK
jgi:hypothetical protein